MTEVQKQFSEQKKVFSTNGSRIFGYPYAKKYILQSIPQALLKNYFKMYQRPKSKLKIIKLLKANLGENIG